jgi:hypothetical protein
MQMAAGENTATITEHWSGVALIRLKRRCSKGFLDDCA